MNYLDLTNHLITVINERYIGKAHSEQLLAEIKTETDMVIIDMKSKQHIPYEANIAFKIQFDNETNHLFIAPSTKLTHLANQYPHLEFNELMVMQEGDNL